MTNSDSPQELRGLAALAEILRNEQDNEQRSGLGPHRRYVLARIDGELIFTQPEAHAIVSDVMNEVLFGVHPPETRRIIKLP